MNEVIQANPDIPNYLKSFLEKMGETHFKDKPVRHEVFSLLGAYTILAETGVDKEIDPRDVLCVIAPEIGPSPQSPLMEFGVYHLFHELLSGELDVDRMDYLGRDAKECGVIYGMFDLTRVLDSICAYYSPQSQSLHLGIQYSGLAAFEDYLRARQSMYLNLYFHKTSVACEAMLKTIRERIPGVSFPASAAEYFKLDEYNIYPWFEEAIESACEPKLQEQTRKLLERLLSTRVLWKKLYEFSDQKPETLTRIAGIEKVLEEQGIEYQRINTSNVLTRLKSRRDKKGLSQNRFHVIKKDNHQVPRVTPIESCSALVRNPEEIFICRIYVDLANLEKDALKALQQKVEQI
jgi:HD superfamily phosphohydrolase